MALPGKGAAFVGVCGVLLGEAFVVLLRGVEVGLSAVFFRCVEEAFAGLVFLRGVAGLVAVFWRGVAASDSACNHSTPISENFCLAMALKSKKKHWECQDENAEPLAQLLLAVFRGFQANELAGNS